MSRSAVPRPRHFRRSALGKALIPVCEPRAARPPRNVRKTKIEVAQDTTERNVVDFQPARRWRCPLTLVRVERGLQLAVEGGYQVRGALRVWAHAFVPPAHESVEQVIA